ncbi:RAMP superfamily CRISPR-associated protein [Polyangium sp. 15x6]|uniref:RAMP superfamily CRISPR-associated protein n=1 Tax=Polyangium sp. 15x6 TaxID=3042687 RepID=UPI00249A8277|nr:RAMP superfamily CRISPR-associated protein [Polyangium sp. 15x6]MDI3290989.1 RAMP superfamily CRISPR-associated protein [Polyangium sp. 15x6]
MRAFEITLSFPAGSVLIGGYASVPDGLHGAHARDRKGRAILPATAIRGALRESLEALLRGADMPACAAGTGLSPEAAQSGNARSVPCMLDDGGRCIACRLFGTQRAAIEDNERRFSSLVLHDARPQSETDAWAIQPGVALSRQARSAAENRLFMRSVPAPSRSLRFRAEGRLLDPELERYFEAAVRGTTHLGSGRSRGMARVEIALRWREEAAPSPVSLPPEGNVHLRVTLDAPASIGVPLAVDGLRDTRLEIPGAALRGTVGFALAEALPDPNDEAFQALVAEEGAQFGFLYPVDDASQSPSAPLPITAVACKYHRREHGIVDTLLDRLAAEHIETATQVSAVEKTSVTRCGAPNCGGPLRGIEGGRRMRSSVPTRTVTRLSMDRARSSAREGQLFTQVLLEEGTVFEGTIRNIPAGSRERLALALAQPLSLGRGRGSGWGRVTVQATAPPKAKTLEERGRAFDDALRRRLADAHLLVHKVGRLVPITLLSPLAPLKDDEDGSAELMRALEAACYLKARRFCREGGWDQRKGKMEPVLATAAGGVFVLDLGEGRTWRQILPMLEELERRGVGQRRHQGFGHVLCFDELICKRTFAR